MTWNCCDCTSVRDKKIAKSHQLLRNSSRLTVAWKLRKISCKLLLANYRQFSSSFDWDLKFPSFLGQRTLFTSNLVPLYPHLPSLSSRVPVYPQTRSTLGPSPLSAIARSHLKEFLVRAVTVRARGLGKRNLERIQCWWRFMTSYSFMKSQRWV